MTNEDMPLYRQFPNACGLTSLLMSLKPPSRGIDVILNRGWDKIQDLFPTDLAEQVEFHWQRVLEYILTATTQHPALRAYLIEHLPTFAHELCPWIEFNLSKVAGKLLTFDHPNPQILQTPKIIMRRVRTMKHNVELKVLAFLFGCSFVPWEQTPDGTGAVFFTRRDMLVWNQGNDIGAFEEKLAFIHDGAHADGAVLWGSSFHWLAARDLKEIGGQSVLYYHDPMGGGDHSIHVEMLREEDRFYIFTFDPALLQEHAIILQEIFEVSTPPEQPAN